MTKLAETGGKEKEWMYLVVVLVFFGCLFYKCGKLQQKQLSYFCILFCFKYDQCGWVSSKGFSNRKAFRASSCGSLLDLERSVLSDINIKTSHGLR